MKMNRNQFKALVKECLVEILQEGLGGVATKQPAMTNVSNPRLVGVAEARMKQKRTYDPALDRPVRQMVTPLAEAVKREAAGNPVMAALLADTANKLSNTGADMNPIPGAASSGIAQQEQFHGEPEKIFENASRWADLAFMDTPTEKTV
jgi:hypothetical protein